MYSKPTYLVQDNGNPTRYNVLMIPGIHPTRLNDNHLIRSHFSLIVHLATKIFTSFS
jgi:hypothetical protein